LSRPNWKPENVVEAKKIMDKDFCGCLDNIGECCKACWCPCVSYGDTQARARFADSTGACCGWCALYCVCGTCLSAILAGQSRSKLNQALGLPDDGCTNYCVHCLCFPCALTQEARAVNALIKGNTLQALAPPAMVMTAAPITGVVAVSVGASDYNPHAAQFGPMPGAPPPLHAPHVVATMPQYVPMQPLPGAQMQHNPHQMFISTGQQPLQPANIPNYIPTYMPAPPQYTAAPPAYMYPAAGSPAFVPQGPMQVPPAFAPQGPMFVQEGHVAPPQYSPLQ